MIDAFVRSNPEKLGPTAQHWADRQKSDAGTQSYFDPELLDESNWAQATLSRRVAYLEQRRRDEADAARALVESTWAQEEADARFRLLQVFQTRLSMADQSFLSTLEKDRALDIEFSSPHRPITSSVSALTNAQGRNASYDYNRLWSPQRPTVVYVGSVAFGLAIIEMSESGVVRYVNGKWIRESDYKAGKAAARHSDHGWTTTKDIPYGRLRLVVYAPYRGVSWSILFQETEARALTKDIPEIVKSIESSTEVLAERVKEAKREAEIRRQEWEAQQARWRQEEDRRRVAESIQESRDQLDLVIQEWARVMNLEQFFKEVENHAGELPEDRQREVLKRLELARNFVGTQDPMDFFRAWRTPLERYVPLAMQTSGSGQEEGEEEDGGLDGESI